MCACAHARMVLHVHECACMVAHICGTCLAGSAGLTLQEYPTGHKYCSKYAQVAPISESSVDLCKSECRDCWGLTYYEALETEFAQRCYVFSSEAECGTLIGYNETVEVPVWSESVGYILDQSSSTEGQVYTAVMTITWPGNTTEVPSDFVSGAPRSMPLRVFEKHISCAVLQRSLSALRDQGTLRS